jgi:protein-S-isoprenylcysteine O-methyltransferase Ste14
MKLLFILFRCLIYVPLFVYFFGWLSLGVRVYDKKLGIVLPVWTTGTGVVCMMTGGVLLLTCIAYFIIQGKGTPAVFDAPTEFVASGPYSYVRNPMYIGGFILLTGFGLYHRSLSMLLLVLFIMAVFHFFVVLVEEPSLKKLFGKSYLEYKDHVKRWVPKWKRGLMKKTA